LGFPAFQLTAVGRALTPYTQQDGTPIQANQGSQREARIEIYPAYLEALEDLEGFERIWLLSYLDRTTGVKLKVVPYRDTTERGLFSTRAPCRPNPIGLSLVRLLAVDLKRGFLEVCGIDLLNETPILDIKPYIPPFECYPNSRAGWFEHALETECADDRFAYDR